MADQDLTFEQWCVEIAGLIYYNYIAPQDYEYYYEQYESYLEKLKGENL